MMKEDRKQWRDEQRQSRKDRKSRNERISQRINIKILKKKKDLKGKKEETEGKGEKRIMAVSIGIKQQGNMVGNGKKKDTLGIQMYMEKKERKK